MHTYNHLHTYLSLFHGLNTPVSGAQRFNVETWAAYVKFNVRHINHLSAQISGGLGRMYLSKGRRLAVWLPGPRRPLNPKQSTSLVQCKVLKGANQC